jgi:hypothetical protein
MDEVSWHVRLDLPTTTGKGTRIIAVRLVPFMLLPRLVPGSSGTLCRQPRRHWRCTDRNGAGHDRRLDRLAVVYGRKRLTLPA